MGRDFFESFDDYMNQRFNEWFGHGPFPEIQPSNPNRRSVAISGNGNGEGSSCEKCQNVAPTSSSAGSSLKRWAAAPFNASGDFRVNISSTEKEYRVAAELAGLKKENVKVFTDDHMLTIEAETKTQSEEKEETFYYKERQSGKISRSFKLPADCNVEKVKSTFDCGLLTLTFPRDASKKSKKEINL